MEYFLAELFDKSNIENIFNEVPAACFSNEKTQLEYTTLFKHDHIKNGLLYCWVYKKLFGIYPSKLDIIHDLSQFEVILQYIKKNTFQQIVDIQLPQNVAIEFSVYKNTIINDPLFVKSELFKKLQDRIDASDKEYVPSYTLYSLYKHDKPRIKEWYAEELTKCKEFMKTNPFSGFSPLQNNIALTTKSSLTASDILKRTITNDWFFMKRIFQKRILIVDPSQSSELSYDGIIQSFSPDYTITLMDNRWLACIPRVASQVIVTRPISSETYTLDPKNTFYLDLSEYKGPAEAFSFYSGTKCKELLKIPRSINIPTDVQNCIFDLHRSKCGEGLQVQLDPSSSNTVLIIDNRANIMSVIAAQITLANLQTNKWSLTVMTKPEHFGFYQKYFPDVTINLISNPMQMKLGKFDIEDYNIMLKDAQTWQMLHDLNIEYCLLVQDDGFIIRPGLEDRFLHKYDFVGPPWPQNHEWLITAGCKSLVGNGGLSLRFVPKMLEIASLPADETCVNTLFYYNLQPMPEDVFFSAELSKMKDSRMPSVEEAGLFGSEMILNPDSIGIHKPWGYFPINDIVKHYFEPKQIR